MDRTVRIQNRTGTAQSVDGLTVPAFGFRAVPYRNFILNADMERDARENDSLEVSIMPRRSFDATKFGVVADGIHDDHDAMQRAIWTAYEFGGGTVIVPDGIVSHHGLVLYPDVRLRGYGWGARGNPAENPSGSVLFLQDGSNTHSVRTAPSAGYHYGCGIENLCIDGNKANNETTGHGVYVTDNDRFSLFRTFIRHAVQDGARFEAGGSVTTQPMIDRCFIWGNGESGIRVEPGAADSIISFCDIGQNGVDTSGKGIIPGQSALVQGCAVWGNNTGILAWFSDNQTYVANRIDYNLANGMYFHGCRGTTISGCNIYRNSAAGSNNYSGIVLTGEASRHTDRIGITGGRIGSEADANYFHKYGIEVIEPTYVDACRVTGVVLGVNQTADIYDPSGRLAVV